MSFHLNYEELVPAFNLHCVCDVIELTSPQMPTNIIRTDQDWAVKFKWSTEGTLNFIMAGTWYLQLFMEKIGAGEFDLPISPKTVNFVSEPTDYAEQITIKKNTVPPGIYKLVAAITFKGPGPKYKSGPIALFGEGPMMQFYEAEVKFP